MEWLIIIVASILAGCLYRMGGCGPADLEKEWGWVPGFIRHFPKKRDVLANAVTLGSCALIGITAPWWAWLLAFGITWGALSTYHDTMFYNWMKPKDNFYLHGFFIGLAMLPVAFFAEPLSLGVRAIALGLTMGVWSFINGNATIEEIGRGALMPLTLAIVLFL
jgi:hypothetical protein